MKEFTQTHMKEFMPSKYQQAVFDWIKSAVRGACAIIQAVAGSGKTTTIVKMLSFLPANARVLFLAFNSTIAAELATRVPPNCLAKTFNAIGHGALMYYLGKGRRVYVKEGKVFDILRDILPPPKFEIYGSFISRLVGLAKNSGIGYLIPDTRESWYGLIDHYDLFLDSDDADINEAIEIAQQALAESNRLGKTGFIDFNDQLYLPLIWNLKFYQNDYVFVDESQDTNSVQLALLKRMVKPDGHVVIVGDRRQAIYGFRGADAAAMDNIQKEFGAISLLLSICYRCAKNIVREAQKYAPEIEFGEDSPDGIVSTLAYFDASTFRATDAIICRNTAPLVEIAYRLISRGKGCRVLGRKIGDGLINLVKKMKAKGIDNLLAKLDAYKAREIAKHASKGEEDKAGAVEDKIECLHVIINHLDENSRTIPALIARIDSMFEKEEKGKDGKVIRHGLTLCTAHKSKGLEFERVFILDFAKYMPSKWARKDWQKEQENNLIYVAITRAMRELYFINSDGWEQKGPKAPESAEKEASAVPILLEPVGAAGELPSAKKMASRKGSKGAKPANEIETHELAKQDSREAYSLNELGVDMPESF